jgi:cytidylate kinase
MGGPIPVIAIDGPAGSGKSSVSSRVAQKFGLTFLSTGSFYRGLALFAQRKGVSPTDEARLAELCSSPEWRIQADPFETRVFIGDEDVTPEIHSEVVGGLASKVSQVPLVRKALLQAQRSFRQPPGLVAEGRDCGTVVFPDSVLKIYLTADLNSRAERRFKEDKSGLTAENIKEAQKQRDTADTQRTAAPLAKAADAVEIDTSHLTLDEVVSRICDLVQERL